MARIAYWMVEKVAKKMNDHLKSLPKLKDAKYHLLLQPSYRQVVIECLIYMYFILDH